MTGYPIPARALFIGARVEWDATGALATVTHVARLGNRDTSRVQVTMTDPWGRAHTLGITPDTLFYLPTETTIQPPLF